MTGPNERETSIDSAVRALQVVWRGYGTGDIDGNAQCRPAYVTFSSRDRVACSLLEADKQKTFVIAYIFRSMEVVLKTTKHIKCWCVRKG